MDNRKSNTLAPLMKDISQALQFDRAEQNEEAYRKYLECTLRITTKLLKDLHTDGGHVQTNPDIVKRVKLGQQCMDRVAIIVNERLVRVAPQKPVAKSTLPINAQSAKMTPPSTPISRDTTPSQYGPPVVSPATPGSRSGGVMDKGQRSLRGSQDAANSQYGQKKLSPMENAARLNQQLLTVFQARQAQARRGGKRSVAANLSLTLQRKMAENLAIAKAQEEILAKKMKERQQRLEEQATRRFHTPVGLSEEEQQQRQIYRRVLEFEQEELWMIDLRKGLETDPTDTDAISKLITSVLGCDNHPLTELLKSYQAKIMKTLYPFVDRKMEIVDRIKVPLPEILLSTLKAFRKAETDSEHKSGHTDSKHKSGHKYSENTGVVDVQQVDTQEADKDEVGKLDDEAVTGSAIVPGTHTPDCSKESEADEDEDNITKTGGDKMEDKKKSEGDKKENEADDIDSVKYASEPEYDAQNKSKDCEMEEENGGNEITVTDTDCECVKGDMKDDDTEKVKSNTEEQIVSAADDDMTEICNEIKTDLKLAIVKGEALKTKLEIENQKLTILSKRIPSDYEKYNQENMDDLFDDSDSDNDFDDEPMTSSEVPASDEEQTISTEVDATVDIDATIQTDEASTNGDKEKKSDSTSTSFESSVKIPMDQSKSETTDSDSQKLKPTMQKNASFDNLENKINDLKNEAYHRYLAGITEDILTSIEKVQILFVIAFEELGSPEGRDQCNVLLESFFFRPLWKYLLVLFRLANEPKELAIAHHMTCRQDCSPRDFSVRERLCLLTTTDDLSSPRDDQAFPYQAAVKELISMEQYSSMLEKLECLVRTSRMVMQCVEAHYTLREEQAPDIGADDLLPILCYVVTRSCLPQIVSECHAMDRFIHEGYMMGEEGYCLTSFQTAINYLISQGLKGGLQTQA